MTRMDDLTQGLDQLRDSIAQTAQVAPQVARREIHREGRAYFRGAVVASVITSLLVGIPLALLAGELSAHEAVEEQRAAQFQSESQDTRRLAQRAHHLGELGLPGEPPVGWTVAEADGSITTCERAEGFQPDHPRYRCSHGAP